MIPQMCPCKDLSCEPPPNITRQAELIMMHLDDMLRNSKPDTHSQTSLGWCTITHAQLTLREGSFIWTQAQQHVFYLPAELLLRLA